MVEWLLAKFKKMMSFWINFVITNIIQNFYDLTLLNWFFKQTGRDNKPDYIRFMPNGSFINIYDYKSVQDLAAHLTYLAGNRAAYEKYLRFKFGHGLTRNSFVGKPLQEVVEIAKRVIGRGERFFGELVAKEKSESKLCKVAKYLRETPQAVVSREIKARRMNRPGVRETCLPRGNLNTDLLVEPALN